jgi:hypothetical protein
MCASWVCSLCSNGRVRTGRTTGERIRPPAGLHSGIRGWRIRNVGVCVKVVHAGTAKRLKFGQISQRLVPATGTTPKKGPAVTGRAGKFWERMPERHDLYALHTNIVQVRNKRLQLPFLPWP